MKTKVSIDGPLKWQPIPGCVGYLACSDGSIWSQWAVHSLGYGVGAKWFVSDNRRQLSPDKRKGDQRKRYTLRLETGQYRRSYGSHFILEAFVGPCPAGLEACHNDGDCTNDAIDNLRWDTPESNVADKRLHGTLLCGEQINTAKLLADDVVEIRERRAAGEKLKSIAEAKGVSTTMVSLIVRRRNWKHV